MYGTVNKLWMLIYVCVLQLELMAFTGLQLMRIFARHSHNLLPTYKL